MKKVAALLILIWLANFSLVNAAITPKPGANCSRLGQSANYQGKKFICIKSGKKLIWDKGSQISKVSPSQISSPAPNSNSVSSKPSIPTYASPQDLSICRIPQKYQSDGIPFFAYPVNPKSIYAMIPRSGPINAVVVPIDFPDAPGDFVPRDFLDPQIKLIEEWMAWFSHGKSHYTWQIQNRWIRAPRQSADYVPVDTPGPSQGKNQSGQFVGTRQINQFEVASELLDVAEKYYKYENMNVVLFIFPKGATKIYDPWTRNGNLQGTGNLRVGTYKDLGVRDKRLVNVQIDGMGNWFYSQVVSFWPWFLHENLHNQGLLGHAPNQGSPLGIMTSQAGTRLPLQSWDSLILDWQLPTDIYCENSETLTRKEIVMSPLEREEIGTKAIMIRISEYEVLVIESRRDDKWVNKKDVATIINAGPDGRSKQFNGLVVYKVDVSKVDPYGVIEAQGTQWKDSSTSFAYYIRNAIPEKGFSTYKGSEPFDLNFMIYEGESLTYRGIKVTLLSSTEHDKVLIEKAFN